MRVLVVGGLGFIGSHLVDFLLGRGESVEIVDASSATSPMGWRPAKALTIERADITNFASIERLVFDANPDCVVHLAAITGVKRCTDLPKESFEINVYGTYNVTMATVSVGSKLIFISSREVYGETLGAATSERAPLRPNNLYGLTKLLGERIVEWAHHKHGLRYTILRLTNVYGPRGEKYGLPTIVRKAIAGETIQLMGGSQVMNFLFVEDAIRAIAKCIDDPRSDNQVFNVGSSDQLSMSQLLAKISELVGRPLTAVQVAPRLGETQSFTPDTTKIRQVLNWSAQVSLDEGIKRLVASYERGSNTLDAT